MCVGAAAEIPHDAIRWRARVGEQASLPHPAEAGRSAECSGVECPGPRHRASRAPLSLSPVGRADDVNVRVRRSVLPASLEKTAARGDDDGVEGAPAVSSRARRSDRSARAKRRPAGPTILSGARALFVAARATSTRREPPHVNQRKRPHPRPPGPSSISGDTRPPRDAFPSSDRLLPTNETSPSRAIRWLRAWPSPSSTAFGLLTLTVVNRVRFTYAHGIAARVASVTSPPFSGSRSQSAFSAGHVEDARVGFDATASR